MNIKTTYSKVKLAFFVVLLSSTTTFLRAQDDNLFFYITASKYLLDKTSIDPKITNAIETALPYALQKDVQGVAKVFTDAFIASNNVKQLDPVFISFLQDKIVELKVVLPEKKISKVIPLIANIIFTSDQYLNHNIVPNSISVNKNSALKPNITQTFQVESSVVNSDFDTIKLNKRAILDELKSINSERKRINSIAFTPFGGCVILYDKNKYWCEGVPSKMSSCLDSLQKLNKKIKFVSFTPTGGFVILYGDKNYYASNLNKKLYYTLKELYHSANTIEHVGFTSTGGYVITYDKNKFETSKISDSLYKKLASISLDTIQVKQVSFDENSGVVIIYEKGKIEFNSLSERLSNKLTEINEEKRNTKSISFIPGGGEAVLLGINGFRIHYPKQFIKNLNTQDLNSVGNIQDK